MRVFFLIFSYFSIFMLTLSCTKNAEKSQTQISFNISEGALEESNFSEVFTSDSCFAIRMRGLGVQSEKKSSCMADSGIFFGFVKAEESLSFVVPRGRLLNIEIYHVESPNGCQSLNERDAIERFGTNHIHKLGQTSGVNLDSAESFVRVTIEAPDTSNTLFMKNSLDSSCEQNFVCPKGYVFVGNNLSYGTGDFCVMAHEARALKEGASRVDSSGCLGGCDKTLHRPLSTFKELPWRSITQFDAIAECNSLGEGYDLISNNQWQSVARNLELQPSNWSSGNYGEGYISTGNNFGDHGYGDGTLDGGALRNPLSKLRLDSGAEIWDFSGNLSEWVKETTILSEDNQAGFITNGGGPPANPSYGADGVADYSASNHANISDFRFFSAQIDDVSSCETLSWLRTSPPLPTVNNSCGFGSILIIDSDPGTPVIRGGDYYQNKETAGIYFFIESSSIDATVDSRTTVGFRCSYQPKF